MHQFRTLPHLKGRELEMLLDGSPVPIKADRMYIVPDHIIENPNIPTPNPKPFVNKKVPVPGVDYTGKHILVSRTGGIGDLFFITKILSVIKEKFKDVTIEFRTSPPYENFLKSFFMPHIIDSVGSIFIPYMSYDRCDYFVTFEGLIEGGSAESSSVNAFILVAKRFFVDVGLNHGLEIRIPEKYLRQAEDVSWGWDKFDIIGFQLKASAVLRTWPIPYQVDFFKIMGEKGYKILVLDEPEVVNMCVNSLPEPIKNYILKPFTDTIPSTFELSCALLKKCKLLIAPDSALIYAGDSLGIPTIGLYSPFSSELRAYGLNVFAVDVAEGCMNCISHSPFPCKWSDGEWSPCLKRITPDVLASIVDLVMYEKESTEKTTQPLPQPQVQ